MINTFNSLFVTMFGLGKIKIIPGTFGSLATIIILYLLFHIINISSNFILLGLVIIFIYSFSAVSSYIKDNENKDPKEIVIDELIGQAIPIYAYEISHGTEKSPDEALIFYCICFVYSLYMFVYFFVSYITAVLNRTKVSAAIEGSLSAMM